MRKLKNAADSGMIARKIIVVPCIVNSWLYASADNTWLFGTRELQADHQRLETADEEEEERGEEVEHADPLVIDRREPAPDAARTDVAVGGGIGRGGSGGCHQSVFSGSLRYFSACR